MMAAFRQHIGSMATFPARFDIIPQTIASIAPQLDQLYLYVNEGFDSLPDLSHLPNVIALDAREHAGDLSARGKIYPLQSISDSIVFTLDDDFIYPPDYVRRMLAILEKMGGRCLVTTHGGIMPARVDWYYERTHVFRSFEGVPFVQLCTLAGSGTSCYDQRFLKLDYAALLRETMVDIQVSLAARVASLPILVVPRRDKWLEPIFVPGLWETYSKSGLTPHTFLAREVDWSFDIYADILRGALREAEMTAEEIGLNPELADCLVYGGVPSYWRRSYVSYRSYMRYLNILSQSAGNA